MKCSASFVFRNMGLPYFDQWNSWTWANVMVYGKQVKILCFLNTCTKRFAIF